MKTSSMYFASILLLASAGSGFAQAPDNAPPATPGASSGAMASGGGGRMAACRDDASKFCSGKTGAERRACLTTNMSSLSDGCKAALAAASGSGARPANQ
jgi:hypothetical protein